MEVLNRSAIKREARMFIGKNTKWLTMFFAGIFIYLFSQGISAGITVTENIRNLLAQGAQDSFAVDTADMWWYTVRILLINLGSIVVIPFQFAYAGYYLNHIRGFNPMMGSLYREGAKHYGKYLGTGLLEGLYTFLWTLLFIILGIVKGLAYSQVPYIIHDNPNLSPSQAIKMSEIMTKDFKGDLFVLQLSFIPWILFIGITCGLGAIYVNPYMQTVNAMYYENLKKFAIETNRIVPEAFGIYPEPAASDFSEMPTDDAEPQEPTDTQN